VDCQYFTLTVFEKSITNLDTMEKFWDIQEAIDDPDTLNGHTIWVGEGYYEENVVINKSINLVGENKDRTWIDGEMEGDAVRIIVDYVNITGFSITGGDGHNLEDAGVAILSDFNNVSGNVFEDNDNAIFLYPSANNNVIKDNEIWDNSDGIRLNSSSDNVIHNNAIWNEGITLFKNCYNNTVSNNLIQACDTGLYLYSSDQNDILNNNFFANRMQGVRLRRSNNNTLMGNTIYYWLYNDSIGIDLYSSDFNNIVESNILFYVN